jgi:hypothetical protein
LKWEGDRDVGDVRMASGRSILVFVVDIRVAPVSFPFVLRRYRFEELKWRAKQDGRPYPKVNPVSSCSEWTPLRGCQCGKAAQTTAMC